MRAARAYLRWSAKDLAEKSGVSLPTIQRMESASGVPSAMAPNLEAVRAALESAGIVFIPAGSYQGDGGPGVRLRGAGE
ncbi:MAG: helix-turn-helix transcriptional regulator [Magnetospirillum sp.]|nr:helix-turn-helix transcriptional regulator [Magnetospirillum sp.]